jgi:Rrf2 family protein
MQLTRKSDYAMRAMVYLARSGGAGPRTIADVSVNCDVPRQFLAKILKDLTQAKLLIAFKGAKGGYKVARKPSAISLLEIIEATGGPIALNTCVEGPHRCPKIRTCGLYRVWVEATDVVNDIFRHTRLSSIRSS